MSESSNHSVSRALCRVCLRNVRLRLDGLICIHGPRQHRCPGSEQPPIAGATFSVTSTTSATSADPSIQHANPSRPAADALDDVVALMKSKQIKILKRIPRGCRNQAARKFGEILSAVNSSGDLECWVHLLMFAPRCLTCPRRGGHRWSLAQVVSQQISAESLPSVPRRSNNSVLHNTRSVTQQDLSSDAYLQDLAYRISSKLEEGDFTGVVRLVTSSDSHVRNESTATAALRAKHPPPHPETKMVISSSVSETSPLVVSEEEVRAVVRSFRKGSASGPDGLRPIHLLNMTSIAAGHDRESLLSHLTSFVNLVLSGGVPPPVRHIFFVASLTALNKPDGDIRPIAVGLTLRQLVCKVASRAVRDDLGLMLCPIQLRVGMSNVAEAAVHATRHFAGHLTPDEMLVKLDITNAFNSLR